MTAAGLARGDYRLYPVKYLAYPVDVSFRGRWPL